VKRFFGTRFFEGADVQIGPSKQAYFDTLISQARSQEHVIDLVWDDRFSKFEFLWYAVERCGLLVRGANQASYDVFEPIDGKDYFDRPVKAVFAANDAAWPMFFALVDRQNPHLRCFWGDALWAQPDDGPARKVYAYAINREAFENKPYVTGGVYLLPNEGFHPARSSQGRLTLESICEVSVRPLARMTITTEDFPFQDIVQPFAFDDLMAMYEIQNQATRKVENALGGSLYYHLERTPLERIQQAVNFIRAFYPGFQIVVGEPNGNEVEVRMRFPAGAIQFCKEEWLAQRSEK
jgi:hypothetical protein